MDYIWQNITTNWLLLVYRIKCNGPGKFDLVPNRTAYSFLWSVFPGWCYFLSSPWLSYLSAWEFPVICWPFTQGWLWWVPLICRCEKCPHFCIRRQWNFIYMILESVSIYPLDLLVLLTFWVTSKKIPPAQFILCNSDRYDASLCMPNFISLEYNHNLVSGFVAY